MYLPELKLIKSFLNPFVLQFGTWSILLFLKVTSDKFNGGNKWYNLSCGSLISNFPKKLSVKFCLRSSNDRRLN